MSVPCVLLFFFLVEVFCQTQCVGPQTVTKANMQMYSSCMSFLGNLTISDPDLTLEDLVLPELVLVNGSFTVSGCRVLSRLGLPSLRFVTGDVTIKNNPLILSLLPLNITHVGGTLAITGNDALVSLDGLSQSEWWGNVVINSNRQLPSLAPLMFTSIQGFLDIMNNAQFVSLFGLQGIIRPVNMAIQNCPLLTTLEHFPSFANYDQHLSFSGLPSLSNISALSPLRQVDGILLERLPLRDLSPLSHLAVAKSIIIMFLANLETLGFDSLSVDLFLVTLCESLVSIEGVTSGELMDSLMIANNVQLTKVSGFSQVRKTQGGFLLAGASLQNVSAFSQLTAVGSDVQVNVLLENLEFLSNLRTVNGSLRLVVNKLSSLHGLRNLVSVGGSVSVSSEQLGELNGVENLERIGGDLLLSNMPRLINVDAFRSLSYARNIGIRNCPMLQDLNGFQNLGTTGGLSIIRCPLLQDITAFSRVTSVTELRIVECQNLSSLSGLANLKSATVMQIDALPNLRELNFPSLYNVVRLDLTHLPITNLNGLKNLRHVAELVLSYNSLLVETSGLCNLETLNSVGIKGSPLLCCSAAIRSLSYACSNDSDRPMSRTHFLEGCSSVCEGQNAVSCSCNSSQTRCYHGGVCTNVGSSYQCGCQQGYIGDLCERSLPEVYSVSPPTVDHRETTLIEVRGVRFRESPTCTINGIESNARAIPSPTPTTVYCDALPDNRTESYYADLVISSEDTPLDTSEPRKLIFYTFLKCPPPLLLAQPDGCVSCSEGAWCDDRRMWPRKEYWSETEDSEPMQCRLPVACPGAVGETEGYGFSLLESGARFTQICARGYVGVGCGSCGPEFGQGSFGACMSCSLDSAGVAEVSLMIVLAFILCVLLAAAITVLQEATIGVIMTVLLGTQHVIVAAQLLAARAGNDLANNIFTSLSFVNFDAHFVKPGCAVPSANFEGVFWSTFAFLGIVAFVFGLTTFVYSRRVSRARLQAFGRMKKQTDGSSDVDIDLSQLGGMPESLNTESRSLTRNELFRQRMMHSLCVLGLLSYFQVCLRCFEGLVCDQRGGSDFAYVLRAAPQTACYAGAYQGTLAVAWLITLLFVVGFPLWCGVQVCRVRPGTAKVIEHRLGFLLQGLKGGRLWFSMSAFVTSFFLALFSSVLRIGEVQTFLNALVFMVHVIAVVSGQPFMGRRNVFSAIFDLVGLSINVVSLGVDVASHGSFFQSYLFWLIATILATASMTVGVLKLRGFRLTKATGMATGSL